MRVAKVARRTHPDPLADGRPADEPLAPGVRREGEDLDDRPSLGPVHGLRASLQDVEPPIRRILGPLDVHGDRVSRRLAVVLLDGQGKAPQLQGLGIGEAGRELRVGRYFGALGLPARTHGELPGLPDDLPLEQGAMTAAKRRLEDEELVGIELPLHDGFAEAEGAVDEHDVGEAGVRVQREHDAGARAPGSTIRCTATDRSTAR